MGLKMNISVKPLCIVCKKPIGEIKPGESMAVAIHDKCAAKTGVPPKGRR